MSVECFEEVGVNKAEYFEEADLGMPF